MARFLFPNFPRHLEAAFRVHYNQDAAKMCRVVLLLGGAVYLSFYMWDRTVDLENSSTILAIRLTIFGVVLSASLLPPPLFVRHLQKIMTSCMLFGGLMHIIILSIVNNGWLIGIPGIILILMYNFVFFRLLFLPALASGLLIALGHDVVAARYFLPAETVVVDNFFLLATLISGAAVAYILEGLFRNQFLTDRALEAERNRANEIIDELFPPRVARVLKTGEKVEAESHGEATVLFADLVGFTALANKLAPGHLMEVLNDYFSTLDHLAEKHQAEKIKTIGDAYMVVSGVSTSPENSAEHIADFALEVQSTIREYAKQHDFPLALRVGISTGQVVSGVVGVTKPSFDLWGETVNLASRMESLAENGRIQVSEPTYWRLHEKYELVRRGQIEVKGFGGIEAYYLVGRKARAAVPGRDEQELSDQTADEAPSPFETL
jgi:adenylate cyclase